MSRHSRTECRSAPPRENPSGEDHRRHSFDYLRAQPRWGALLPLRYSPRKTKAGLTGQGRAVQPDRLRRPPRPAPASAAASMAGSPSCGVGPARHLHGAAVDGLFEARGQNALFGPAPLAHDHLGRDVAPVEDGQFRHPIPFPACSACNPPNCRCGAGFRHDGPGLRPARVSCAARVSGDDCETIGRLVGNDCRQRRELTALRGNLGHSEAIAAHRGHRGARGGAPREPPHRWGRGGSREWPVLHSGMRDRPRRAGPVGWGPDGEARHGAGREVGRMRKRTSAVAAAALLWLVAGTSLSTPWSRGNAAMSGSGAAPMPVATSEMPGHEAARVPGFLYATVFAAAQRLCLRPEGGLCLPASGGQCFAASREAVSAAGGASCPQGTEGAVGERQVEHAQALVPDAGTVWPGDPLVGGRGLPDWIIVAAGGGSRPWAGMPSVAAREPREWSRPAMPILMPGTTPGPDLKPGVQEPVETGAPSAVPLPPGLPLLLAGVAMLGLTRRARPPVRGRSPG